MQYVSVKQLYFGTAAASAYDAVAAALLVMFETMSKLSGEISACLKLILLLLVAHTKPSVTLHQCTVK